ncbi:hypothetical protein [Caballeronia sp. ATUFL_M1_KS5A]|uniref:hypothetical protein n=1 Tax=Caballeronia sp. ATUFL_M1_KS5A TaxID=2921778 RepID=UPI0020278406|nr:hypothetical protein [Caballeronia sp. ATUFL_M1_KS5A]
MAQGFPDDDEKNGGCDRRGPHDADPRHDHDLNLDDSHRWPSEAPSVAVARVVLKVDAALTLKRTAAAAGLTAHHHAVPSLPRGLPLRPTRMELAVVIALADLTAPLSIKRRAFSR